MLSKFELIRAICKDHINKVTQFEKLYKKLFSIKKKNNIVMQLYHGTGFHLSVSTLILFVSLFICKLFLYTALTHILVLQVDFIHGLFTIRP